MSEFREVQCNSTGGRARIFFAITETGHRMPVDVEPNEDGNVIVFRDAAGIPQARVRAKTLLPDEEGSRRYVSHFSSCLARKPDKATTKAGISAAREVLNGG